jgi:hypothetical protein
MIYILILLNDPELAALIGRRLAAAGRDFDVTVGGGRAAPPDAACDFVITDAASRPDYEARFSGACVLVFPSASGGGSAPGGADCGGRISGLASRIRLEYAARGGKALFLPECAGGAMKYIGCFGLSGGCGASSVALGVGRYMAAYQDKRVLYISLELVEAGLLCIRKPETEGNAGDFLYLMLKNREDEMKAFLEAFLYRDSYGLTRFYPSPGLNDLARASLEEAGKFLRIIRDSGRFDRVVLDFGSEPWELRREIAGLCDAAVLVENGALPDAGKRDRLRDIIGEVWRRNGRAPVLVRNMIPFTREDGTDVEPDALYAAAPAAFSAVGSSAGSPVAFSAAGSSAAPPAAFSAASPAVSSADGAAEVIEIAYDTAGFRIGDGAVDFVLSNEFGAGIGKLTETLARDLG